MTEARSYVAIIVGAIGIGLVAVLVGLFAVPASAQDQDGEDSLDAARCIAIISNNAGSQYAGDSASENNEANQYDSSIVQECNDLLESSPEDVIKDTIPDEGLPKTGGASLLGVAIFSLLGAGLGVSILRRRF